MSMTTKGAALLEKFTAAVAEVVDEHIREGRARPIYKDGVLVGIKLKTASLYGEMRNKKK